MPSSPHSDLSPTQKSPRLPRQPHRVAGAVHCPSPAVKTRANEPPSAKGAGNFTHSKFNIQNPSAPPAVKLPAVPAVKSRVREVRCAKGAGNFTHSKFKIQHSTSQPLPPSGLKSLRQRRRKLFTFKIQNSKSLRKSSTALRAQIAAPKAQEALHIQNSKFKILHPLLLPGISC